MSCKNAWATAHSKSKMLKQYFEIGLLFDFNFTFLILHFYNKSDTSIIMSYIWISIILLISINNSKTKTKKNKCVYFAPMCYPNRKKRTRHDDYILHNLQGVFPFQMPLRRRLNFFFLLGHFFNTFWHTLNFLLLISFMNFF